MDPNTLAQLNEAYRHGVYTEETLSEEELVSIEEWVEALIEEGYDLDQYSDEELYLAYLSDLDEGFKPTNYTHGPNIFHGRGRKAQQIDRQIEKFKKTGDVRAQQIDFVNRMMDDPEGRKDSIAKSRENRMTSTNKAREDAKRDIKKYGMGEELDLYDIVSEYLVSEGFCDSYEDADVIMANMSEEWRESIMEEVLDEVNRPEREMIKKGLLKPGRQVARIRNLNRQSGNTNWYAADPRDTRAIKTPGKGGVFNSRQRREQEADAFNTSRRRREHEFDQDSSRARKTGDWSKVDKKRPLGGHKTRFEKEREERNNRTVYGD